MDLEELIEVHQLSEAVVSFCTANGLIDLLALDTHYVNHGTFTTLPGCTALIEDRLLDLLTVERLRGGRKAEPHQADATIYQVVDGADMHRAIPPTALSTATVLPVAENPGLEQLTVLFGLSVRAFNVCENAGLYTLSQIRDFALEHGGFKMLRNCGAKTQMELSDLLVRSAATGYAPDRTAHPDGAASPDRMEAICSAQYLKLSTQARNVLQGQIGHPTADAIIRFFMRQGRKMPKLPGAGSKVMRELRAMRENTMTALTDRSVEWPDDSDPRAELLRWALIHQVDPDILPYLQHSDGRYSLFRFLERYIGMAWNGSKLNVYRTQLLNHGSALTLETIAAKVGLTRERVRQLMVNMDHTVLAQLSFVSDLPGVHEHYPELVNADRCMVVDVELVRTLNAREGTCCSPLLVAYIAVLLNHPRLQLGKWTEMFDRTTLSKELDHTHPLLMEREWVEELKSAASLAIQVIEARRSTPERRPLAEILVVGDKAPSHQIVSLLCTILPLRYPEIFIEDGCICLPANAKRSQEDMLEEVLAGLDEPSHVTRIQEVWSTRFLGRPITVEGIRSVVVRNKSLFFSIGRESTYGLRRWENERHDLRSGTIRDIVEGLLQASSAPLHLEDLVEDVQKFRPGTYLGSVKLNLQMEASGRFVFLSGGFVGLAGRSYDRIPDPPAGVPGSLMRASVLRQFVGQHRSRLEEHIAQRCSATPKRIERVIDAAITAGRIQLDPEGLIQQGQAETEDHGPWMGELPFEW